MANVRITGFVNEGGVVKVSTPNASTDSLVSNADLIPDGNNTQKLGTTTLNWSQIHTRTMTMYGTLNSRAIIPTLDATYDLGDPESNVWNNVFSNFGNFGVVNLSSSSANPDPLESFGQVFSKDVAGATEVFVQDAKGNVTQISPHNSDGEWQYFSKNVKTGKVVRINMERMIRRLEEITGESFMEEWYEDIK
jgi:hypothetical protein